MTDTKDAAPKADASVQSDAPTAAQTADASSSQGMCVEVTLAPAAVYNGEPDEERVGL